MFKKLDLKENLRLKFIIIEEDPNELIRLWNI